MADDINDEKIEILKAAGFHEAGPGEAIDVSEFGQPLRMMKFTPPPLLHAQSLFWTMAIRDGQMYAAPLGTPYDLTDESWLKVDSMDHLRKFFGVQS